MTRWGTVLACVTLLAAGRLGSQSAAPTAATTTANGSVITTVITTFNRDVAPIVFARCGSCHRPAGAAPFSLLTYADARQHATQIAEVTSARIMPPWKVEPAESGLGEFVGLTPLTEREIGVIQHWVKDGSLEGAATDLPVAPQWTDGWQLGAPDLVVTAEAYTLRGDGTDVWRILVVPLPVTRTRFVRGMEFRPGNAKAVHHATIRLDPTPTSRRLADEDPGPGYSGLIARTAGYPDGHLLGWTPGQVPPLLPKGLAWRLDRGSDLVIELHLQPTGKDEVVQPSVGLFFTDDPPERTPTMLRLGRQNIDIAPGGHYLMTDSFTLPVDVEVQAVQPHAHYRAHDVSGSARLPDGTTKPLIYIKDWDFRWQHVYRLVKPLALPKGTVISARYTYDNSDGNPRNPEPAAHVQWGQRSSDEMGDLWIQVLTRTEHDRELLNDAFRPKMLAEDVVGYQARLQRDPDDASLHDDVALLNLELGRVEDAVSQFRASAALKPESAAAKYNLGFALASAGRLAEAIAEYRAAIALKPEYALAHNNLGGALLQQGQIDEAASELRQALALDPDYEPALHNMGTVYRLVRAWPDAITSLDHALRVRPDDARPMTDLAMLLAACPVERLRDPKRALTLAERAVALTGGRAAPSLDVLGVAFAANGQFDRALRSADDALALQPDAALAREVIDRKQMYAQRRAYVIP